MDQSSSGQTYDMDRYCFLLPAVLDRAVHSRQAPDNIMGCSCSREGEVCLSSFCEGGACCAAPCSAHAASSAEMDSVGAPHQRPDGSSPEFCWRSGGQGNFTACDSACAPHTYREDSSARHDAPITQDMCATGGAVSYHDEHFEAFFIAVLVVLAMVCTVFVYWKLYREKRAKGAQLVVMAMFVGEMSPRLLPIAVPVQLEQLSRMSVVEAVAVTVYHHRAAAAPIAAAAQP